MPRFDLDMQQHLLPSGNFTFTALPLTKLGASKYALATLLVDKSQSCQDFWRQLEECMKIAVRGLKLCPYKENVLLRVLTFDHRIEELHGFVPVLQIDENTLDGCLNSGGGSTALYGAWENAIEATQAYAEQLVNSDYDVMACIYGLTDGLNNNPPLAKNGRRKVGERIHNFNKCEKYGHLTSVLIGVNTLDGRGQPVMGEDEDSRTGGGISISDGLFRFKTDAGIQQYLDITDADPKKLARLGEFISRSISSVSKNVATGNAAAVPVSVATF